MQNTTTSKEQPNLLFENFIISGLSQDELIKLDFTQEQNIKKEPQILFSMFQDEDKQEMFLKFIWPKKINIYNEKQDPKTHSFNIIDSNRNQTYFHCLIFTEEVCSYLIKNDFDANGGLGEKILQHLQTKINKKGSGGEEDGELLEAHKAYMNKNAEERQFQRLVERRQGQKPKDSIISRASKLQEINKHREYMSTLNQRQFETPEQEQMKKIQDLKEIRKEQVRSQAVANEVFHDIRQTVMNNNESFITQMHKMNKRPRAPTNNLPSNLGSSQLNNDINSQINRRKSDIGFQNRNGLNFNNQKSNLYQENNRNHAEILDDTLNVTSNQENTFMFDEESDHDINMKFEVKTVEQTSFVSGKSAQNFKNLQSVLPSLCKKINYTSKKQDISIDKDSLQNKSFYLDDQQNNGAFHFQQPKVRNKNNIQVIPDRTISFDVQNQKTFEAPPQLQTYHSQTYSSNQNATPNFKRIDLCQQNEGTRISDNIFKQNKTPNFQISELTNIKEDSADTVILRNDNFQSFQSNHESLFANSQITPRKQDQFFHKQKHEDSQQGIRLNSQTVINNESFEFQKREDSEYTGDDLNVIENIKADVESHNKELRDQNFVPVALVIQTKLEYHDHFRMILRSLYESIVNRDQEFSESLTNKYSSFGEQIYRGEINEQDEFQIDPIQFQSEQMAKDVGTQVFKNIPDIN